MIQVQNTRYMSCKAGIWTLYTRKRRDKMEMVYSLFIFTIGFYADTVFSSVSDQFTVAAELLRN